MVPADESNYIPPKNVAKNADKGIKYHNQFNKGGTAVGLKKAHDLSQQKPQDTADLKKMYSYFARHSIDKNASDFGNDQHPSKGYIAWLLWGGDEGQDWVNKLKKDKEF